MSSPIDKFEFDPELELNPPPPPSPPPPPPPSPPPSPPPPPPPPPAPEPYTKTHTTNSLLKASYTKTHTTNSLLKASYTKTHTTNSLLGSDFTKTHTTNNLLKASYTKTHTTNSLLKASYTKTHTTNSLLGSDFTKTHTTNSLLKASYTKTHTTNSLLKASYTKTHTTNSLLGSDFTKTHTTNSLLKASYTKTHTTNSLLGSDFTKTHTTNSLLKASYTKSHTTNSLLGSDFTKTHTTNSRLKASYTKSHTTNSLLGSDFTKTHTTNSLLKASYTKSHTTNSLFKASYTKSHTTNSFIVAQDIGSDSYSGLWWGGFGIPLYINTISHFTQSLLFVEHFATGNISFKRFSVIGHGQNNRPFTANNVDIKFKKVLLNGQGSMSPPAPRVTNPCGSNRRLLEALYDYGRKDLSQETRLTDCCTNYPASECATPLEAVSVQNVSDILVPQPVTKVEEALVDTTSEEYHKQRNNIDINLIDHKRNVDQGRIKGLDNIGNVIVPKIDTIINARQVTLPIAEPQPKSQATDLRRSNKQRRNLDLSDTNLKRNIEPGRIKDLNSHNIAVYTSRPDIVHNACHVTLLDQMLPVEATTSDIQLTKSRISYHTEARKPKVNISKGSIKVRDNNGR
jgi:hypothetical protein